ncbi:MAG: hypothetical protein NZ602_02025 [Thermoguttaceae bacterium]|nr:hypothetical protein [Thermoguttaceae bacterium]MDW8038708.1 hypothetical protein [Thermoguttaceae bacterium]
MIDSAGAQYNAKWAWQRLAGIAGAIGILLLMGGYWFSFFSARLPTLEGRLPPEAQPSQIRRIDVFLQLLLFPDQWVGEAWFGRPREFALWDRLPVLWWAGVVLGTGWAAGWLVLHGLHLQEKLSRLETHCFSLAVGANLVSTYTLAVGLAGLLRYQAVFWIPTVGLLAAVGWANRNYLKHVFFVSFVKLSNYPKSPKPAHDLKHQPSSPKAKQSRLGKAPKDSRTSPSNRGSVWWVLALAPFATILLLGAMLPPVDFDVREYHLQAPKEWCLEGRITFLPHNVYANMPLGAEMLALAAMGFSGQWWLGALAGKTVMASMTLVCAASLWAIGRRMVSSQVGLAAAAMYLATPWIIQVSTAGLNEGVTACYGLLALWALWLWTRQGQTDRNSSPPSSDSSAHSPARHGSSATPAGERTLPAAQKASAQTVRQVGSQGQWSAWGYLVLGGYLVGAAAGTKYPAVLFIGLPAFGWVGWQACRISLRKALPKVGVFLLAAFLGGGLWYVKNACLAGNPVYPLFYSVLGGKAWDSEKEDRWNQVHLPRRFTLGRLADDLSGPLWRSQWIGPLIVPLTVLAFLRRSKQGVGEGQCGRTGRGHCSASPLAGKAGQPTGGPGERDRSKAQPLGSGPPRELPPHPNPLPQKGEGICGPDARTSKGTPLSPPLPPGPRDTLGNRTQSQEEESAFRWLLLGYLGWWIGMWWLATHRIDRFGLPALPMAALLAGMGAYWSESWLWRLTRAGVLVLGLGYGFLLASGVPAAGGYNRYFVPLDRLRTDPERVDPWHLWLNRRAKEGRVLLVGDAQPFDLEMPVLYATCFNTSPLEEIFWEAYARTRRHPEIRQVEEEYRKSDCGVGQVDPPGCLTQAFAQAVKQLLAEREIKYIFVHWGEIARYRSPGNYGFTPLVQPAIFAAWVRWGVLEPVPPLEGHPGQCYRVRP